MIFILYKMYILSSYINTTLNHKNNCTFSRSITLIYPQGQGFRILPSLRGHFVQQSRVYQSTHKHTPTIFVGTIHRRNGFYTVKNVFPYTNYTPKPTYQRKLSAFLYLKKKRRKKKTCMIHKVFSI